MWSDLFDERQQREIEFCKLYAKEFAHGTNGHNDKIIIAKMAEMLDKIHYALPPIGLMGEYAEHSKKEIVKIMGFNREDN